MDGVLGARVEVGCWMLRSSGGCDNSNYLHFNTQVNKNFGRVITILTDAYLEKGGFCYL